MFSGQVIKVGQFRGARKLRWMVLCTDEEQCKIYSNFDLTREICGFHTSLMLHVHRGMKGQFFQTIVAVQAARHSATKHPVIKTNVPVRQFEFIFRTSEDHQYWSSAFELAMLKSVPLLRRLLLSLDSTEPQGMIE